MKGIIIWEDNERATYCELINNASLELTQYAPKSIMCSLKGEALESSKAVCSKEDTYDFETGALISLMKMCGLEKSAKAYAEIFDDTAYGDALIERDKLKEENKKLKEKNAELLGAIGHLRYAVSCNESTINSLENTRDLLINKNNELIEENKRLKAEKDLSWKNYQRNIQKKQDRINELEAQITVSEDDKQKNIEYYEKELKRLNNVSEDDKQKNIEIASLKEKIEKIKLDCEKLQNGYVDIDNVPSGHWDGDILDIVFLPGRACGKQYKTLVDLFKKIDQKKVDAAYKEAYNTTLPVWQKEVFKQLRKDQLDSLLEAGKYAIPYTTEWIKSLTKREEMWGKILGDYKHGEYLNVKVEKASINDFLSEAEVNGILWGCGEKPTEHNYWDKWKSCRTIVFRIRNFGKMKELTWGTKPKENTIVYLPPMRWDLFEKGRIVIKVEKESYDEFCSRILSHFDKVGVNAFNHDCKFGYFAFNKDTRYVERILSSDNGDAKEINRRKVVDWEDVR